MAPTKGDMCYKNRASACHRAPRFLSIVFRCCLLIGAVNRIGSELKVGFRVVPKHASNRPSAVSMIQRKGQVLGATLILVMMALGTRSFPSHEGAMEAPAGQVSFCVLL